jgi:Rrf2 family protein
MVELAKLTKKGLVSAEIIARNQEISEKYIHILVSSLVSAGLVRAVRGVQGGYEIVGSPEKITALDVILAMEGKAEPAPCLDDKFQCSREAVCPTHDLWKTLALKVSDVLAGYSLANLVSSHYLKQESAITFHI